MPDVFRCLRCEYSSAYSLPPAHSRLRVHWAPGIPRALVFKGREFPSESRARRAAERRSMSVIAWDAAAPSTVIVRESGRSSIPETSAMKWIDRGVLDTPHARDMTAVGEASSCPSFRRAMATKSAFVIPGWSERPDLRCAIAHRRISRFRVRCCASPRNDGLNGLRRWRSQ